MLESIAATRYAKNQAMKPVRRFLCLVAALALGLSPAARGGFRAGAARANITPALGTRLNGGLGPGVARQVHDELWVRALVLDDGATRLAFVVVDTCLLDRPVFDTAKQLVQQHTDLPPDRVMMSCTHTHSAGAGCGVHLTDADETYRRWLPGRIDGAVRCAVNNLAPARIALLSDEITRLRDREMCRGGVTIAPPRRNCFYALDHDTIHSISSFPNGCLGGEDGRRSVIGTGQSRTN